MAVYKINESREDKFPIEYDDIEVTIYDHNRRSRETGDVPSHKWKTPYIYYVDKEDLVDYIIEEHFYDIFTEDYYDIANDSDFNDSRKHVRDNLEYYYNMFEDEIKEYFRERATDEADENDWEDEERYYYDDFLAESPEDDNLKLLRRNYLQAKKDFETKGEKDNNDVLSREDKMWIAKGQMDDYERKGRRVKESVADPREYDLEDLGMTSEEADRARQEADDELTRLMDRMGVDANDAANHSRWSRVVDDIAYLVASCRRYDIEPYKYND